VAAGGIPRLRGAGKCKHQVVEAEDLSLISVSVHKGDTWLGLRNSPSYGPLHLVAAMASCRLNDDGCRGRTLDGQSGSAI
jgi:hypothetical protein